MSQALQDRQAPGEIVLSRSGRPYGSVKSAETAIVQLKLDVKLCQVVRCENGFGILTTEKVTQEAEAKGLRGEDPVAEEPHALYPQQNTSIDTAPREPSGEKPEEADAGKVIAEDELARRKIAAGSAPAQEAVPAEKYFRVHFHAKQSATESDDVVLSVNGEVLVCQREQDVVLPQRYLECASHAVHPQYKQLPGEPRKVVARIRLYPFDNKGEATRQEFIEQRDAGTKKTREMIEQKSGGGLTLQE